MKILHTSDWHLGGRLHDQDRTGEHEQFLDWLLALLAREKPDALVVAGDVFDTFTPSNRALELYYSFLGAVCSRRLCRQVVVVGGNHDSPSLIDSPDKVLVHLSVQVVGTVTDDPAREAVWVPGAMQGEGLVIGAVPYLREGDLRAACFGEDAQSQGERLRAGFREHYARVAETARALGREKTGHEVPLLLTGHFYLTSAQLSDDMSERGRLVGGLGEVGMELLPAADYVALGHLHVPQAVGRENCRYSGSPIPLSFSEARTEKSVVVVELGALPGEVPAVRLEAVPCFQRLEQVHGTIEAIETRLDELVAAGTSVWVDVQVTEGEGGLAGFWQMLTAKTENTQVKILVRRDNRPSRRGAGIAVVEAVPLDTLEPADVFSMLLDEQNLGEEDRALYLAMFGEIVQAEKQAAIQGGNPV